MKYANAPTVLPSIRTIALFCAATAIAPSCRRPHPRANRCPARPQIQHSPRHDLCDHTDVEVVVRGRSVSYAEASRSALPDATQVADSVATDHRKREPKKSTVSLRKE